MSHPCSIAAASSNAHPETFSPGGLAGLQESSGRRWCRRIARAAAAAFILGTVALPASAAVGTVYAGQNLSQSGGILSVGARAWVSDHVLGFCRLDPSGGAFPNVINQATCSGVANSPGQAAFDGAKVYVPDNSSKSKGVSILTFNSANNGTVSNSNPALVLAGNAIWTNSRASAVALGPDGSLYVGFLRSPNIYRIASPAIGGSGSPVLVAKTSDSRRGISAMAFVGTDLYLAETGGVSVIRNATTPCNSCTAGLFPAAEVNVPAPTFVASYAGVLYVSDLAAVYRYRPGACGAGGGGIEDVLMINTTTMGSLQNVSALGFDSVGGLLVSDDTSAGVFALTGRVFQLPDPAGASAEASGACGAPPAAVGPAPALGAAITQGKMVGESNFTLPTTVVKLGSELWVSDHLFGFCRLNVLASGLQEVNQASCSTAAASPGQAAVGVGPDGVTYVFVPDDSSKSMGVWRLKYDPTTRSVGSPVLLANGGGGLSANRATAVALGPDKNLYVVFKRNSNVLRVATPFGATQAVQTVGKVSDKVGPPSLTFVGSTLYFAEGGAVTQMTNPSACTGGCVAQSAGLSVPAPVFVIGDGSNNLLYIAELNGVARYTLASGTLEVYATAGTTPSTGTSLVSFSNVSALGLDGNTLYVGDDPTAGGFAFSGRIWSVAPPTP